jgi:hypothetical protein
MENGLLKEERHVCRQAKSRAPPHLQSESQTLRLPQLWGNLPERPRQAVLASLIRIVAAQASPDVKEVTHENA